MSSQAIQTSPMADCLVYTTVTQETLERKDRKEHSLFHRFIVFVSDIFYD